MSIDRNLTRGSPEPEPSKTSKPEHHPNALAYEHDVLPFVRPFAEAVVQSASAGIRRAVEAANSGMVTVLDHGAGTGLISRMIHVDHPIVKVHALDPNEAFLSHLDPAPWLSVQQGVANDLGNRSAGADTIDKPDPFASVVSNLTLMFCPDPRGDLEAIRRSCRPGASLSLTVLGPADLVQPFNFYWTAFHETVPNGWAAARYPHHGFADPERLRSVATDAGWTDITVAPVTGYRQIEGKAAWEWLSRALPIGQGDRYTNDVSDADRSSAQRLFLKRWAGARYCRSQAWLLTATNGRWGDPRVPNQT